MIDEYVHVTIEAEPVHEESEADLHISDPEPEWVSISLLAIILYKHNKKIFLHDLEALRAP